MESRELVELSASTPVVSRPPDMDWETGAAELVAMRHNRPVLRYVANDGTAREVALRPIPLGQRNAGDQVLVESEETGPSGRRQWKLAMVRI